MSHYIFIEGESDWNPNNNVAEVLFVERDMKWIIDTSSYYDGIWVVVHLCDEVMDANWWETFPSMIDWRRITKRITTCQHYQKNKSKVL